MTRTFQMLHSGNYVFMLIFNRWDFVNYTKHTTYVKS
jgi:hypothetical protein